MCFRFSTPSPPNPPPLAPAPPPPLPPTAPLPADELVSDTDINPKVRDAKSKKEGNQQAQGTQGLRINRDPQVNTGTGATGGGINV